MKRRPLLLFAGLFVITSLYAQDVLLNPLLPSGADPWAIYHKGYYYYTHTTGDRVNLWKTKNIADLRNAPKKTVFLPPAGTSYSKGVWAPEIHYINHRWYIYVAADSGKNESHRLFVLENKSKDPFKGKWILKGQLKEPLNKWAIDGSVFNHNGQLYLVWSGWEGDANGEQDIFLCKMKNAWTLEGNRVRISRPAYDWETHGDLHDANNPPHVSVNEGPEVLEHGPKLFIVYSASGCWTDYYGLGMLTASTSANLMDSSSWVKSPRPVFVTSVKNHVYAPGHNSFFKSPDGKEDWILYHANSEPNQGCGRKRSPRAQPFTWNADGTPNFGEPIAEGVPLKAPGK
jgi:GH43 family beta-xylosidase